jgi:hypothetical protein
MLIYRNDFFTVTKSVFNSQEYFLIDETDYVCCLIRYGSAILIKNEFKAFYERVVPNIITGGILPNESTDEAVFREILEEAGITRRELITKSILGPFILSPNRGFARAYLYVFELCNFPVHMPNNVSLEQSSNVVDWYRIRSLPPPWYFACFGDFSRDLC